MMDDYRQQFSQLTQTVDQNNIELDRLRKELTDTQNSYYQLRSQNEIANEQIDSLKARRDLNLGLNE